MTPDLFLRATQAATRLLDRPVREISLAAGGANSQIFRVDTGNKLLALKAYPTREDDQRPRAKTEWEALTFFHANGVVASPRPIALDEGGQFLLMEWINGKRIGDHRAADVADAASFIAKIFALSDRPGAEQFPLASEACLSAAEIVRQVKMRIVAFDKIKDVTSFIAGTLNPILERTTRDLATEISAARDLEPPRRRLIPADFGFHNALRQDDGSLRFIDFDYFGWDDPVKLTADFILHPGMSLTTEEMLAFAAAIAAAVPGDRDFGARLRRYLPLFAVRWALILFNPLRPDRNLDHSDEPKAHAAQFATQAAKARTVIAIAESMVEKL